MWVDIPNWKVASLKKFRPAWLYPAENLTRDYKRDIGKS